VRIIANSSLFLEIVRHQPAIDDMALRQILDSKKINVPSGVSFAYLYPPYGRGQGELHVKADFAKLEPDTFVRLLDAMKQTGFFKPYRY
jgi:hypothetical protein